MKAREIMSREVKVCSPSDTLGRAAQLMWENDCGSLPVVEGDSKVTGMVTDRDICMAAYTQGAALHGMRVSSAMSHKVFVCRPSDDLTAVQREMRAHRVHRLPIIGADNKLMGIISLNDIARAARQDGIAKAEVAETLAAVCAPVSQEPVEASFARGAARAASQGGGPETPPPPK